MTKSLSTIAETGKFLILPVAVVGIMFSFYGSAPPLEDCGEGESCNASSYSSPPFSDPVSTLVALEERPSSGDSCPPGSPFCGGGGGCFSPMSRCMSMFSGVFGQGQIGQNGAEGAAFNPGQMMQQFGPMGFMQQWFQMMSRQQVQPSVAAAVDVSPQRLLTAN